MYSKTHIQRTGYLFCEMPYAWVGGPSDLPVVPIRLHQRLQDTVVGSLICFDDVSNRLTVQTHIGHRAP